MSGEFKKYEDNEIRAEHILDAHGTFLAIRYPDNHNEQDNIVLLQNAFINIFSYLFEVNLNSFKLPAETRKGHFPQGAITNKRITFGADSGKSLEDIFGVNQE